MNSDTIIGLILYVALFVFGILCIAMPFVKRHRTDQQIAEKWEEDGEEPPLTERHVRVLETYVVSEIVGVRMPKHRNIFNITVRFDDGTTEIIEVDEAVYASIRPDTSGTLAFVGDRVFGYCEDDSEESRYNK